MRRPEAGRVDVGEIFRAGFEDYCAAHGPLPAEHYRIAHAIQQCRTAQMGGHVYQCDECKHQKITYNSCGNRHCPKCQAFAGAQWVQERIDELLPVPYFHGVFTLPAQLNDFALRNKRVVYNILFRATAETLQELAGDPKRLGATIGFIPVLHTWGQNLLLHPHLHCIIPSGGLSPDGTAWKKCRGKKFLFPVPVMRTLFRGKFLDYFKKALDSGDIKLHGILEQYRNPAVMQALFDSLYRLTWVVYVKPPFASPECVIKYLGRYTHRVAISNQRIVDMKDGNVSFRWKDYADGSKEKVMTLQTTEFIRRFLLHALPQGFMRIRHYGFLSNRSRADKLALCARLLGKVAAPTEDKPAGWQEIIEQLTGKDPTVCPECNKGRLRLLREIPRPPPEHLRR